MQMNPDQGPPLFKTYKTTFLKPFPFMFPCKWTSTKDHPSLKPIRPPFLKPYPFLFSCKWTLTKDHPSLRLFLKPFPFLFQCKRTPDTTALFLGVVLKEGGPSYKQHHCTLCLPAQRPPHWQRKWDPVPPRRCHSLWSTGDSDETLCLLSPRHRETGACSQR